MLVKFEKVSALTIDDVKSRKAGDWCLETNIFFHLLNRLGLLL